MKSMIISQMYLTNIDETRVIRSWEGTNLKFSEGSYSHLWG